MGRALLIEGSGHLRTAYSDYLSERGIEVYTAQGREDGMALLSAVNPAVTAVGLDAMGAAGANAYDLIGDICGAGSLCLVIAESFDKESRLRAFASGADGYAAKPIEPEELFLRLRNMIAHRRSVASDAQNTIFDMNGVRVDLLTRKVLTPEGEQGAELTATELALLRMFAENAGSVVPKETLFGVMRGDVVNPATRSLDVGVSRLRIKLRNSRAPVDIRSVRQTGYILTRSAGPRVARPEA